MLTTEEEIQAPEKKHASARSSVRCSVCGAMRINVTSGSVCPDDFTHGKIFPHVDKAEAELAMLDDFAKSIPDAIPYEAKSASGRKQTLYRVAGVGGLRMGRKVRRIPNPMLDRLILAKVSGCVYYFFPIESSQVQP